jgi:hypothetical protein
MVYGAVHLCCPFGGKNFERSRVCLRSFMRVIAVDVKDFLAAVCRSIHSEDFCEVNGIYEL